ncbi:MAG TPA: PspC domain-containing protein [Egibacteraceae bacterium]|nr:PspC domain-containing protein [Egibacteraceae bacterium]
MTGPIDTDREPMQTPAGASAPRAEPLLRRPTDDRVVFGVAGGLGRYLGIDPVLIRIGFVLLAIFGGSGVLLYLIGLIAIPEQKPGEAVAPGDRRGGSGQGLAVALGAGLVIFGTLSLLGRLLPALDHLVGPALLIAAGVFVIMLGGRR